MGKGSILPIVLHWSQPHPLLTKAEKMECGLPAADKAALLKHGCPGQDGAEDGLISNRLAPPIPKLPWKQFQRQKGQDQYDPSALERKKKQID